MTSMSTRRGVFGAIAAAPLSVTLAAPAPASPDRTGSETALHRRSAAWRRLDADPVHQMHRDAPGFAAVERDGKDCIVSCGPTRRAVCDMPATDYRAVIEMLELRVRNHGGQVQA